jgi:hypothetical protein
MKKKKKKEKDFQIFPFFSEIKGNLNVVSPVSERKVPTEIFTKKIICKRKKSIRSSKIFFKQTGTVVDVVASISGSCL